MVCEYTEDEPQRGFTGSNHKSVQIFSHRPVTCCIWNPDWRGCRCKKICQKRLLIWVHSVTRHLGTVRVAYSAAMSCLATKKLPEFNHISVRGPPAQPSQIAVARSGMIMHSHIQIPRHSPQMETSLGSMWTGWGHIIMRGLRKRQWRGTRSGEGAVTPGLKVCMFQLMQLYVEWHPKTPTSPPALTKLGLFPLQYVWLRETHTPNTRSDKINLLFSFPYAATFADPTRNPHLHLGRVQPRVTQVSVR